MSWIRAWIVAGLLLMLLVAPAELLPWNLFDPAPDETTERPPLPDGLITACTPGAMDSYGYPLVGGTLHNIYENRRRFVVSVRVTYDDGQVEEYDTASADGPDLSLGQTNELDPGEEARWEILTNSPTSGCEIVEITSSAAS